MGRVIYAEENLLDYLRNLTKENSSAVGLIIGQSTKSKDYVVHLARTPEERDKIPDSSTAVEALTFNSVKDIEESVIADHAKHVTRMLPGGFSVLGAFICSASDIFYDASIESKLKKILVSMKEMLTNEPFPLLYQESEKLLLHFNPVNQKYTCQVLDISCISCFKPADWKFSGNYTQWCQISTTFDMNWPSTGGISSHQLKTQLKDFLSHKIELLNQALVVFDGQLQNVDHTLETVIKKKADKNIVNELETEKLEASIYTSLQDMPFTEDFVVFCCDFELHMMGVLRSQVFVCQKTTVEEAVRAVKQDIVRSLASRLEMHWDSLIEEEYGSPEEKQSIHEPPRRVTVSLPDREICFSDYIFPGEGACEVISSFRELLDIEITKENVNEEYEIHGDPSDLCGKSAVNTSSLSSDDLLSSTVPNRFLIVAISFAAILVAIAIALQMQRNASLEKKN